MSSTGVSTASLRVAKHVKRSNSSFPLLTWVECDCGCGWAGYDDVTQFLIEEALTERLEHIEAAVKRRVGNLGIDEGSPGASQATDHQSRMRELGVQ